MSGKERAQKWSKIGYICVNKGCASPEFEDFEPEFFRTQRNNQQPPRNCFTCRELKKTYQCEGTLDFSCQYCIRPFRVSWGRRWMCHRNEEPWKTPECCNWCGTDKARAQRAGRKAHARRTLKDGRAGRAPLAPLAQLVKSASGPQPVFPVSVNASYYANRPYKNGLSTLDHILKGSGQGGGHDWSSVGLGPDPDPGELLAVLGEVSQGQPPDVLAFNTGEYVAKCDTRTGVMALHDRTTGELFDAYIVTKNTLQTRLDGTGRQKWTPI